MRLNSKLLAALAVSLAGLAVGAAPSARAQGAATPPAAPAARDASPPASRAVAVAPDYTIGPGDGLNVFVFNHPELSMQIPVRPDGKITMPLVDDMVAAGRTPNELARELESRLAEYLRGPKVSVMVTGFVGGDQVRVIGKAAQPKSVPFRANMTLLDVLIEVGGLAEFAAGNRAKLIRQVDGKTTETRLRLNDLVNRGDMKANVVLKPGDIIMIPESRF